MGEYTTHGNIESNGALIMRLSEDVIRPFLMKKLKDCRTEDDMPVDLSHVRGIALNMAQEWVKYYNSTVH